MNTKEENKVRRLSCLEWRDKAKEVSNLFRQFAKDNNLSNDTIRKIIFSLACEYKHTESEYAEYNDKKECIDNIKETFENSYNEHHKELWKLFVKLEGDVVDFLIDHPDLIKSIQDASKQSSNEMQSILPNYMHTVDFQMNFEDVIGTLKGRNFNGDMYIGFNIGNKNISLM